MVNDLTISGPATGTLTFGGGTNSLAIFGSLLISATGVTLSLATNGVGFCATTIGKTITTNGLVFNGYVNFCGRDGEWTLGSAFNHSYSTGIYFNAGSFITNNYNVGLQRINSPDNSGYIRSFNWGSSTITFSGSSGLIWSVYSNPILLNWNAGTSTFSFPGSVTFEDVSGSGLTFYNIVFNGLSNLYSTTFQKQNTFNNFTLAGSRPKAGACWFLFLTNQTINGSLNFPADIDATYRIFFVGINATPSVGTDLVGTQRTLTVNSVSNAVDVDFRDIKIAGAVGTLTGTRLGDCGGNSGITFDAPKTVYMNPASSTYSTAGWAIPSAPSTYTANNFPLAQDTAYFDGVANCTFNLNYNIGSLDFSKALANFTWTMNSTANIYGNINLRPSMKYSGSTFYFSGANNQTFTSNGGIIYDPNSGFKIVINKPNNSSFILNDAFNLFGDETVSADKFILTQGILDLNGYTLSTMNFVSNNSNKRTINFNGAAFYLTGSQTYFGNYTWNTQTSTNLTVLGKPDVYSTFQGYTPNPRILVSNIDNNLNALINFYITGGTDPVNFFSNACVLGNIDVSNFFGTLTAPSSGFVPQLFGNLILGPNVSVAPGQFPLNIRGTGKRTIKTSNVVINFPLTFDFPLGYANYNSNPTVTLLDDLTLDPSSSNGALTISGGYGIFDANNYNVTCNNATISSSTNDNFYGYYKFGDGKWTITGPGSSLTMSSTGVGAIFPGNSTIFMTSVNPKTFTTPGGGQLPKLCQAGNGTLTISNTTASTQFNDIFANTFPSIITLAGALSCNNFTLSGRAGALVTLNSSVAATGRAITKVGGGTVSCNYLSIQDSLPSGGSWYAGPNSTRVSNFGIWAATNAPNSNIIDII
jgi:hypothetical protein